MSAAANERQMVNVQVDGEWKQFPKGTRLIDACLDEGKPIPHYCYHPKLSVSGNCRMCLVELGMPKTTPDRKPIMGEDGHPEINWSPRPAISCATEISEGMAVRTDSPMVKECREGVLEFLLLNHPLDCPICDKAGECRLQEYSVQHGAGQSEFLGEKVKKPKRVDIGKHIILDDERCIMCSRCIRFMQEVAHDDVLGFTERGSHTTLAVHPGRRLDSNYSLNTVDICPVGALTSKDFRFDMRVWFLKETKTIDVNCATGTNIIVSSRENVIHRINPRENDFVNSCWMPDSHRLNFHYLHDERRLKQPVVRGEDHPSSWDEALEEVKRLLKDRSGESVAILASARFTNEELYLAGKLRKALKAGVWDVIPRMKESDGFLVAADRNPNTAGARLLFLDGHEPGARLSEMAEGIRSGKIRTVLALGEDLLRTGIAAADLDKLEVLIATDILPNATTDASAVLLPASGFAEKRGSMINLKNRLQRLNRAIEPPGLSRDDWEIFRDLLTAVTGEPGPSMIEDLFRNMAEDEATFSGWSLSKLGDLGVDLNEKDEKAMEPQGVA